MTESKAPCLAVGLTGGIGSGKTTVSDLFKDLGIEVIDADEISHELTHDNHPVLKEIQSLFGPEFVTASGNLNRARMRQLVFDSEDHRRQLESILHPAIRGVMDERAKQCKGPYCILSIPLLLEGNGVDRVDRVLVVDASDIRRKAWIKRRSGLADDEIDRIFAAQVSRERRLEAADDVIENNGSIEDLGRKVAELDRQYRRIAASA